MATLQRDGQTVHIKGELNFETVSSLYQQGLNVIADAKSSLAFDLSGVSFSNSAGLALLLAWTRAAKRLACSLQFTALPKQMQAMAEICNLFSVLPMK